MILVKAIVVLAALLFVAQGAQAGDAASSVKLSIVYDDRALEGFLPGFGFSCLVEMNGQKILLDTGTHWETLSANMDRLGIDPTGIDAVFISHLHHDHTGGLGGLARAAKNLTVYLPASGSEALAKYLETIGHRAVRISKSRQIAPGIFSTGEISGPPPEQGLILKSGSDFILVCGCAHPGVVTMTREAKKITGGKPFFVLGGFHLARVSGREINGIAKSLQELETRAVAPCHCSGEMAILIFKSVFGQKGLECKAGKVFRFKF